ncbi:glycoside hydrolase family 5 protein [Aureimonas jatrophae]|nr:cellulase family glycosylhydrolase [Aureimonas jatrophae]MBB3950502.1 endoglucanase [Aureimonas jatrophae]
MTRRSALTLLLSATPLARAWAAPGAEPGANGARPRPTDAADEPAVPISFETFATRFAWGVNMPGLQYERPDPSKAQLDGAPIRPLDWKWDYLASKGIRLVRLPFLWEHTQPRLFGPLGLEMDGYGSNRRDPDRNSLQMIKSQVAKAEARGIKVVLECKNYGARAVPDAAGSMAARTGYGRGGKYAIGSPEVPHEAFADFWHKMAAEFASDPTVIGFDIMNEPTKMVAGETWDTIPDGGRVWTQAARQAIRAIREAGAPQWIIVEGYSYATTGYWDRANPDLHTLKDADAMERLAFSPHLYFDANHSGTYKEAEARAPRSLDDDRSRMTRNVAVFKTWMDAHGFRHAFVGETGAPNTPDWQDIQEQFLLICRDNGWPVTLWGMWPRGEGNANVNDLTPIGGTKGVGGTETIAMETLGRLAAASAASGSPTVLPPRQP